MTDEPDPARPRPAGGPRLTCRLCAEEVTAAPGERCPSCGERLAARDDGPAPTPPAVVLSKMVGTLYLGAGSCCGLGTFANAVSLLGVVGSPGGTVAPFVVAVAVLGALCVLHAGAGLGLLLRQDAGRLAGIACAALDLALGLLVLVASGYSAGSAVRPIEREVFLVQTGLGAAMTVLSCLVLHLLLRRSTRAAFQGAAASPAR